MTTDTANLAAALAKVQAELPKLERDRTVEVQQKNGGTYSYSYVTLAYLNEAALPLLSKHGLAFAVMPGAGSDGKMAVRYALLHESGERLEGEFPISGEGGIQMIGGRITYARRYILSALLGIAADEDDESRLGGDTTPATAQRASRPRSTSGAAKTAARKTAPAAEPPPLPSESGMSRQQQGMMHALFAKLGIEERDKRLKYVSGAVGREVATSNDLTGPEVKALLDRLQRDVDKPADPAADVDAFPEEGAS